MSRRPIIQLLLQVLTSWLITQALLRYLHPILTIIVIGLVALITATIYGLRFERGRLGRLYPRTGFKQFIDMVCAISRQQPPVDAVSCAGNQALRLKTPDDFNWLSGKLNAEVFGHRRTVESIATHLQKTVEVRRRSEPRAGLPPLGVFLLVGSPGIGKQLIAKRLAGRLYEKAVTTVIDLADYADADAVVRLFGASGREGSLVTVVKRRPYHVVVLENIDQANPRVQQQLQSLIMQGACGDPTQGGTVSFQNCLIFMTSTAPITGISDDDATNSARIIEQMVSEKGCSAALLRLCNHLALLKTPDEITQAKVILQLMIDECRKYQLDLDYVEPEIIADQLYHFSESAGFENCKVQLSHLMSGPIHLAVSNGMDNLVLTREMLQLCPPEPAGDETAAVSSLHEQRSAL